MAVLHYSFHSHPKIVELPKATIGVYALALSYASGNLTDGFIPDSYARHIDPKRHHFNRLIAAGLASQTAAKRQPNGSQTARTEDDKQQAGYELHDYLDYNPSKLEIEAKREEARQRMKRVRANKTKKPAKRSREHKTPVTPNVHDIGIDKVLKASQLDARARNHTDNEQAATTERVDVPGWTSVEPPGLGDRPAVVASSIGAASSVRSSLLSEFIETKEGNA